MPNDGKKKSKWRVLRILDGRKGKNFGVYKAEDCEREGISSPYDRDNDAHIPCYLANLNCTEARQYVRDMDAGRRTLGEIRDRRQQINNMMYSGMN